MKHSKIKLLLKILKMVIHFEKKEISLLKIYFQQNIKKELLNQKKEKEAIIEKNLKV